MYLKWRKLPLNELHDLKIPLIVVIVVIGLAVISALTGIIASLGSSVPCRCFYLSFIITVLVIEVAGLVCAFVFRKKVIAALGKTWTKTGTQDLKERNDFEKIFNCCGWNPSDKLNLTKIVGDSYSFLTCGAKNLSFAVDCHGAVSVWVGAALLTTGIIVLVLAAVDVILLIAAICLVCYSEEKAAPEKATAF
jgi:uncharacterized membrane protein